MDNQTSLLDSDLQDHNSSQNLKDPDFKQIDAKILSYWSQNKTFETSVEMRKNARAQCFSFYDGPPFANGLPHYGHLLTGYLKDTYGRYQTMKGLRVERRFGWDCHGLPAEMQSEKELGISGKLAIQEFGVEKFNLHCATSVMKYVNEWEQYVERQGRWVDFKNSYKTMDLGFMESVIWAFKELYNKGYVYESLKILPYSYGCQTPLSNFETRLDNSYREVVSKTATVCMQLDRIQVLGNLGNHAKADELSSLSSINAVIWTTTPWTLPSNLAIAVHKDIDYALLAHMGKGYIIAANLASKFEALLGKNYIAKFKGADILGVRYKPIFEYFAEFAGNNTNVFSILHADYVSDTDGTGLVHTAPGFGEEDYELCKTYDIPVVCPIDEGGKFTSEVADYQGRNVFDTVTDIIIALKHKGAWLKTEDYRHNYPHCWRTDTKIIYRAVSSWYISVTKFKDRMLELNQNINWIPAHVKDNLFGKWLENARDWSISRNRFWGAPIPIWKSDDPKYPHIEVYGSIHEIEQAFQVKITNLHKEHLDQLTLPNPSDPTGKSKLVRCPDVFDCWFESGSMPFAQVHYPFENKEWFEANFPADFIVEYAAQTRGWFYTLMVLGTALFDQNPFKTCIAHGVVLDQAGQKLSKRLNNYENPLDIFDKHGSDALRLTMIGSAVTKGADLKLDSKGEMIGEHIKRIIKPVYNALHFLLIYRESDGIQVSDNFQASNILDKYILLKLKALIKSVGGYLDEFDSVNAVEQVAQFVEVMNNWFIRRSRSRFWKKEKDQDKQDAYDTLYTCLIYICRVAAPLMPFIAEDIFLTLLDVIGTRPTCTMSQAAIDMGAEPSIHLCDYPVDTEIDSMLPLMESTKDLERTMDLAISICSLSLSLRNKFGLKVRQPLRELKVGYVNDDINLDEVINIIKDEINVKEIAVVGIDQIAQRRITLNFPQIAQRIPGSIKQIIADHKANKTLVNQDGQVMIGDIGLEINEYTIEFISQNNNALGENGLMVSLDLEIDTQLKLEGIARDVVRSIQNMRKQLNLPLTQIVPLTIKCSKEIAEAVGIFHDYIRDQCLISEIQTEIKSGIDGDLEISIKPVVT